MNEQDALAAVLQSVVKLLGGDNGWAPQVLGWVATLRIALKPLADKLTAAIDKAIQAAAGTPSVEDDNFINAVLRSKGYRWFSFAVDWLASVKLPQPTKAP